MEYQDYNHFRYSDALQLIQDCGMPTPPWADRISSMLPVLAHMTLPDGTYVPLGDTDRRPAKPADHPNMRWVSTEGEEGEPPAEIFVTYHAGFSFARSGWGTDRDHLDEHHLSVRHGEPRQMHGHLDHGSVTLFADRQPLLTDPGKYRYGDLPERRHVLSAEAHNVVTIGADCAPPADRRSEVTSMASDEHVDRLTVEVATCAGTRWSRTIGFLRETGEVIVVDDVRDPSARDVVQRWQLEVGATVELLRPDLVHATWPSGSQLLIEQLAPVTTTTSLAGDPDPLRGWVSERYGELTPAANLEATAPPGDQATFITVIRPSANPRATPSTLQRSTNGFTFRVVTAAGQTRFFSHPP